MLDVLVSLRPKSVLVSAYLAGNLRNLDGKLHQNDSSQLICVSVGEQGHVTFILVAEGTTRLLWIFEMNNMVFAARVITFNHISPLLKYVCRQPFEHVPRKLLVVLLFVRSA
jgi:hypothetical protein